MGGTEEEEEEEAWFFNELQMGRIAGKSTVSHTVVLSARCSIRQLQWIFGLSWSNFI